MSPISQRCIEKRRGNISGVRSDLKESIDAGFRLIGHGKDWFRTRVSVFKSDSDKRI